MVVKTLYILSEATVEGTFTVKLTGIKTAIFNKFQPRVHGNPDFLTTDGILVGY